MGLVNSKISKPLALFLVLLMVFSLMVRIYRITEPDHKYFDEVYHVVTAEAYARNDPAAYNPFSPPPEVGTAYDWLHPPLVKLIQALSINILGDRPFAWRLPSAIFGTGIVVATFVLAYIMFGAKVAVFSSFVIAFENLNLVLSRITMNDVFVTFFILVSFIFGYLYLRTASRHPEPFDATQGKLREGSGFFSRQRRDQNDNGKFLFLILTSVFLGLAASSKWTGFYAIAVIFVLVIFKKLLKKKIGLKDLILLIIPIIIYLSSYSQFWLQGHTWRQFVDLHKQIWWYQNKHDLQHPYGTTPIYCVPKGLDGPKTFCPWVLNLRPVYYSYEQYATPATPERSDSGRGDKAGYIYALGNPFIFWFGFIAVCYLTLVAIRTKNNQQLFILLGYFIFWVPWVFSPRIMFLSHYLPSIPFMAICLGIFLNQLNKSGYKYVAFSILALFIFAFFYFYPITTGYPIEVSKIDKFMWIKSWR